MTCLGCSSDTRTPPNVLWVLRLLSHSTRKKSPPCMGVVRSSISLIFSNGSASSSFFKNASIVAALSSSSGRFAPTFGMGTELSTSASIISLITFRTYLADFALLPFIVFVPLYSASRLSILASSVSYSTLFFRNRSCHLARSFFPVAFPTIFFTLFSIFTSSPTSFKRIAPFSNHLPLLFIVAVIVILPLVILPMYGLMLFWTVCHILLLSHFISNGQTHN